MADRLFDLQEANERHLGPKKIEAVVYKENHLQLFTNKKHMQFVNDEKNNKNMCVDPGIFCKEKPKKKPAGWTSTFSLKRYPGFSV